MALDCKMILDRNLTYIEDCIQTYKFKITKDELLKLSTIYVNNPVDLTFRVFGELKHEEPVEVYDKKTGEAKGIRQKPSYKTIAVYNFSKKKVAKYSLDEMKEIYRDFLRLADYFSQLKMLERVEAKEFNSIEHDVLVDKYVETV